MGNCCQDCCEIAKYSSTPACHVWSRLLEPPEQMSPANNVAWTFDERTDATCVNGHRIPTNLYDKFDLEPI